MMHAGSHEQPHVLAQLVEAGRAPRQRLVMADSAERRQRRVAEAVIDEELAVLPEEPLEFVGNVSVARLGAAVEQVERLIVDAGALVEAANIEVRVTRHDVLEEVVHELPRDGRRTETEVTPRLVGREARWRNEPGAPQVHAVAAPKIADCLPRIDELAVLVAQRREIGGERASLFGRQAGCVTGRAGGP